MTHLTQVQLSMLADNALPKNEAERLHAHIGECSQCQSRLAQHSAEVRFLATALQIESSDESSAHYLGDLTIPKFRRPLSLRNFALANLATGLVIWLAGFLWKTLFGELVVNATSYATSIYLPDIYAMASTTALYLLEEGTAMFDAYLGLVVTLLAALTGLSLLLMYRRSHHVLGVCLVTALASVLVAPAPVQALDIRRDQAVVTIADTETIDDTVIAAAETVLVAGTIKGDLIAMGRRVDVTGNIEGNLITFAETVTVSGQVAGTAIGGARTYDLLGASVAGDLWVGAEKARLDSDARVAKNATIATESSDVSGFIGRDLLAMSETIELSGTVGNTLQAYGARVRLLGDAQVGGDLQFHGGSEERLLLSDNSKVTGKIEYLGLPEEFEQRSDYTRGEYYLFQAVRLLAAFLVGIVVFWLFPGLRSIALGTGMDTLKSAGLGFILLIAMPIALMLVAVTLVGLPLAVFTLAAWLLCIYLAKIIIAFMVGRMLISDSSSWPIALLAGLAIVILAVNLPFIGGVISFVFLIIGLGMLVQYLIKTLPAR